MTTIEQLEALLGDIGPATPEISGVYQDGPERWRIILHDETEVELLFDEESQKIALRTEVGTPPGDRRLETYELVLVHNYSWQETGGAMMALDGAQGELILTYEISATETSLQQMQAAVFGFAGRAESWKKIIAVGIDGTASEQEAPPTEFVRV